MPGRGTPELRPADGLDQRSPRFGADRVGESEAPQGGSRFDRADESDERRFSEKVRKPGPGLVPGDGGGVPSGVVRRGKDQPDPVQPAGERAQVHSRWRKDRPARRRDGPACPDRGGRQRNRNRGDRSITRFRGVRAIGSERQPREPKHRPGVDHRQKYRGPSRKRLDARERTWKGKPFLF